MAKTIVFCATEDAAERMRAELSNLNADMMKINPDYVVRITGSDTVGKSKLDYFISTSSKYPVIATTSKLLSTGADCKMTKLIVLDEMIGSMTEFKQIVGRGTRLREDLGKTHFVIMDFRGVTRLFADPDWDGPIEQDVDYDPKRPASSQQSGGGGGERTVPPIVGPDGCRVEIIQKTVSVYDADGKLLRQENIVDYTKSNIRGICASLEEFLQMDDKQQKITELLKERGIDLASMKKDQGMEDVDDFDFLCHVAFDQKPKSRRERAENVKKRDFLSRYGEQAREVLNAIIDRYAQFGIYEIENRMLLTMPDMRRLGGPSRIAGLFGGPEGYRDAIRELERELYDVA